MNTNEVTQAIEHLARALRPAAEHVYRACYMRAVAMAVGNTAIAVVALAVALILEIRRRRMVHSGDEFDVDTAFAMAWGAAAFTAVGIAMLICAVISYLSLDYRAMNYLMDLAR